MPIKAGDTVEVTGVKGSARRKEFFTPAG